MYFACPLMSRLKTSGALTPLSIRLHDVHKYNFTFVFNILVGQTFRRTERRLENPCTYFAVRPFMVLSTYSVYCSTISRPSLQAATVGSQSVTRSIKVVVSFKLTTAVLQHKFY